MTTAEAAPPPTAIETEAPESLALGIDIGGTGIKWALVQPQEGRLARPRQRVETPQPASVAAITEAVRDAIGSVAGQIDSVGVGLPAVVRQGVALTQGNLAGEWRYVDAAERFSEAVGRTVSVLNDGDAAGLAEMRAGAGVGVGGVVVLVTLGTGVGTSVFSDGRLVPNTELGRIRVRGKLAGERVSNRVRKTKKLSWEEWAADLQEFIVELDRMLCPELVIIGGGVSGKAHEFLPFIAARPTIVPAKLRNDAGIVGAALYGYERQCLVV